MVNGEQYVPDALRRPSEHRDEVLTFLALGDGDGEDSKRVLLLLADDDDDFRFDGDDVETVTQRPHVETQS